MYRKMLVFLSATFLLLFTAHGVEAGGWATVTLDEVPLLVRADEPVTLGFMVLQHGHHPLELGQMPKLIVQNSHSGEEMAFQARGNGETGHYVVEVTFPSAGEWRWRADISPFPHVELGSIVVERSAVTAAGATRTGVYASLAIATVGLALAFWRGSVRRWQGMVVGALTVAAITTMLMQMPHLRRANAAPAPADAAYGQTLFAAKGCTGCHLHDAVPTSFSTEMGPNLTLYERDAEFLRAWLRDPQAVRADTSMPNLQLSDQEIDALIAFLSQRS